VKYEHFLQFAVVLQKNILVPSAIGAIHKGYKKKWERRVRQNMG